ncbi:MAG: hypothetical protein HKO56_05255, partial [Bacteroidia bacterium]|nr:hypothetical protein [Bacteroidia bacterium]
MSISITEPPLLTLSETHVNVSCNGGGDATIDITPLGGTIPTELAVDLFISEYGEGFGNSDWIEIYNGTGAAVNLADYEIWFIFGGGAWPESTLALSGVLADNSTYLITRPDADAALTGVADLINAAVNFTGDDAVGLARRSNTTALIDSLVDGVGTNGADPGAGWDVAGTTNGTRDRTLVRKATVFSPNTNWNASRGTNASNSEWIVNPFNDYTDAQQHTFTPPVIVPAYTYLWSNAETVEDIDSLSAGTYTVTVTDVNACTATLAITITEPASLTISETHIDAKCNSEASGSIDITVGGGTTPYTFNWSNGATTEDVSSLLAGIYTVTVTDNEGCTITISATIGEPTAITLTDSVIDASCNGGSDGSIDITSSGGTGTHNYFWNIGSSLEDISGLAAGTYTVTVTDANFCTATFNSVVGEPTTLAISMSKTNTSCSSNFDGTATATPSGATPPYTYLWSTGATAQTITALDSNVYTVTVTDSLGCFKSDTIRIPFIPLMTATANITSAYNGYDVSCLGANDGFGSVLPSGGTPMFTYIWSNGQTGSLLQNVTSGAYTATITDSRGCTATDNITLTDPPGMSLSLAIAADYNGENISCFGASDGAINSASSGGATPYTYLWSTGSTIDSLINIPVGNYTLTVTDANGCAISADTSLTEPDTINLALSPNMFGAYNISCAGNNDGFVASTVSSGTAPYTYLWSNGATNADNNNLTAGFYELTVTDANGCTTSANVLLTEPPAMSFTTTSSNPSDCGINDAIINVTPSGGIGTYLYSLDGVTYQTQNFWNTLSTGTYNIYVKSDTGNCISGPQPVVIGAAEVPIIDNHVIIHPTTGASNDGGVLLQVSGNGLALEYSIDGITWQTSNVFSGLSVGSYTVTVRYVTQNCISTVNVTLIAGNGVEGSVTNSQICSDGQSATQYVSLFYIPMPSDDILTAFLNIYNPS